MPIFQWKARTRQGSLKKGEIEAMNEAAVMAQLRSQMLLPVAVKEKSKDISEYLPFLKPGIKTRDLVIFTRQFATMIDAGLPLVQKGLITLEEAVNRSSDPDELRNILTSGQRTGATRPAPASRP